MTYSAKQISVVIPMYNEADNVEPLLTEIQQALTSFCDYEIIVVDDGSSDATSHILKILLSKMSRLRVISHRGNFGQSAGIVTGVRAAKYSWIATLDGDGQNDPADIIKLFETACMHYGPEPLLIAGHRNKRKDTWIKKLSSKIANTIRRNFLKDNCPDTGCGLKIFRRDEFLKLPHFNHMHRFLPALYRRLEGRVINVPVNHRPRTRGISKYGMMNRLWVGIVDLIGVSWLIKRALNPHAEEVVQ